MSKNYYFYCNACGEKFKATRDDARTCSQECRLAISNANKKIREEAEFDEEQEEKYKESIKSIEGKDDVVKGVIKKGKKDKDSSESEENNEEEDNEEVDD